MLESEQHSHDALSLQAHMNQSSEQIIKWLADFIQSLASDPDSESDSGATASNSLGASASSSISTTAGGGISFFDDFEVGKPIHAYN